jgi:hypothetical protein
MCYDAPTQPIFIRWLRSMRTKSPGRSWQPGLSHAPLARRSFAILWDHGRIRTMADEEEITGMYELLDALEETLRAADPAKREALAKTIDAYQEDFPDDFHWAVGA